MPKINIYSRETIIARTKHRSGETKLGETIHTIPQNTSWQTYLKQDTAKFVVLGIPEDIGVRANHGRGGAYAAWKPSLDFLLNMQSNQFCHGEEILVLGHIELDDLMAEANSLNYKLETDIEKARLLVAQVDERVSEVITIIAAAGKIPIIVGGGHNNAYPIIKGINTGAQLNGIHVINCDPHSDMRPMLGRHSGNGFLYAYSEGYLKKYAVFGLHESYNIYSALELFEQHKEQLHFETYDDIFVREQISYQLALNNCLHFCKGAACGVEIDLDSIQNVPVSARTPSGMLPIDVRKYVYHCGSELEVCYLHIAEGAPVLAHKQMDNKTGKLVAYIITDFVKAVKRNIR